VTDSGVTAAWRRHVVWWRDEPPLRPLAGYARPLPGWAMTGLV